MPNIAGEGVDLSQPGLSRPNVAMHSIGGRTSAASTFIIYTDLRETAGTTGGRGSGVQHGAAMVPLDKGANKP